MNKQMMIVTSAGLVIGFAEALVYYNLGRQEKSGKFTYGLPKGKELGKTLTVVLVTSLLTALLSNGIEHAFRPKVDLMGTT